MDSRDIRFPFGHSRPCQLTPLLACAILEDFGPSPHGRGLFFERNRASVLDRVAVVLLFAGMGIMLFSTVILFALLLVTLL